MKEWIVMRQLCKVSLAGAFAVMAIVGTAHAGSGTFKHSNGAKVHIKCKGSGCYVRETSASGKRGKSERVGEGGRTNYDALVKQWNSKGYK
jgi:hypothetical protein